MPANDRLYIIFHPLAGEAHAVPWRRVDQLVRQAEAAMGAAARALLSHRHTLAEPRKEIPDPRAILDGTVQAGSILLPLAFDLAQMAPILARPLTPQGDPAVRDALTALADVATVAEFCRGLLFGERGVIARMQKQAVDTPPASPVDRMIETVAPQFLDQLEQVALNLMSAAEQTGCELVEVQINDQSRIRLTRAAPRRTPFALAPVRRSVETRDNMLLKRSGPVVRVRVEGRDALAFPTPPFELGRMANGPALVLIWREDEPIPEGSFRVQGRQIDREDVEILEDIPEDWPRAAGVFLVEKYKPEFDWR